MSDIFLAPKYIVNHISIKLRKILWQGGKTQGKNFNLVNWNKIMEEKTKGELGIKDLGIMNKAFGAKLVWRFISGEKYWWKEVPRKKYIKNQYQNV